MKFSDYTNVSMDYPLPEETYIWQLFDAGLENLKLNKIKMPQNREDELLARIDAVGVCASDYKLVTSGNKHARLQGRNLQELPVTPGHEVALTIVKVGSKLKDKYTLGMRCTIQADIIYNGEALAYGYKLQGAYTQFQAIGKEIISGNYLLRIPENLGYSQAAIAEPWACVYNAYKNHRASHSIKPNGIALFIGAGGPLGLMHIEKAIADGAKRIIASDISKERLQNIEKKLGALAKKKGIELICVSAEEADSTIAKIAPAGVDDIMMLAPVARVAENALQHLAKNGFMNIFAGFPNRENANINLNAYDLHYRNWTLTATSGSGIEELEKALKEASDGRINPNNAVAAVAGLNAVKEAIAAVQKGLYPGRIVIYPQILDMPLTAVEDWTNSAEKRLIEENL